MSTDVSTTEDGDLPVRIGLEMFGTQTAGRYRGIGRYCRNLATGLLACGGRHEFVFYAVDGLPIDLIPEAPNATLRRVKPEPHLRYTLNRLVRENPDALDVLVLGNPLELNPGNDLPTNGGGLKLAAVVYDLIPLLFADQYVRRWPRTEFARRYFWGLERLRSYDLLLAISEATRADTIRVLNVRPEKVVTVGTAGDDHDPPFTPESDFAAVRALGIDGEFVFSVAPPDPRKNLAGLVEAYALLPEGLRQSHKLVAAVGSDDEAVQAVRRRAETLGVRDGLVLLTRPVDDSTMRALYQGCSAFAFPSLYEGFGLPILEAMRCGAPVVAGDNSSQPEVAGDAALLVNAADPAAVAGALGSILTDKPLARSLRARGPARAALFSWETVAGRVIEAVEGLAPTPRRRQAERPRIAFFSPLPPNPSGVATYASALLDALGEHYAIDLFHDSGEYPTARFQSRKFGCFDHRLFDRLDRVRPYHAVVYQMGNSPAHLFAYERLLKRPGVVALHDLALSSFHYERTTRHGNGLDTFRRALEEAHPGVDSGRHLADWSDAPEAMVRDLTAAGLDMNRQVVTAATAVIVHSRGALERLGPEAAGKAFVVPLGTEPTKGDRVAARAKLGLPPDALIVGSFGIIHPSKLNVEAIEAFAELDQRSLFLVVGAEADGGLARNRAETLGLVGRVRFLGRPDDATFHALIAAIDLGVALRRPPTNGESSAALLDLLRAGVPTVVTDTGSFGEFPEGAVRKVRWDGDSPAALTRALLGLASDPDTRAALGRAGLEHVQTHHAWPRVSARYAEVIERSVRPGGVYRGPHRAPTTRPIPIERGER